MEVPEESFHWSSWDSRTCYPRRAFIQGLTDDQDVQRKKMRSLGHFSSFGIACLSFSFLSLEVSFGSLRERERETVDNFPEITRNRKKKRNESWLPSDPRNLSVRRLSLSSHHHFLVLLFGVNGQQNLISFQEL